MPRYSLTLEYDGRGFVGWQRQDNGRAVQQAVEEAITSFCGAAATVFAAGRTDAGVHALGQVVHVDLPAEHDADTVRDAINFYLKPDPVAVLDACAVSDDFHARFSATERQYRYCIINRRAPLTLQLGLVWQVRSKLDTTAMHAAAQRLIGRHDFTTFRASQCQAKSPVKTLDELTVTRDGDAITVFARARSFLHHQVRSMVGSLRLVGEGKWSADDLTAALAAADRTRCGPVSPPDGLYLTAVRYDAAGSDPADSAPSNRSLPSAITCDSV